MGAGVKGVEGGGSLVHHFGGMSGALHESLSVLEYIKHTLLPNFRLILKLFSDPFSGPHNLF